MAEDFTERFLELNANIDFIASEFADVIRNLMRAYVSQDQTAATLRAAQHMDLVTKLLARTEEDFTYFQLFSRSLKYMTIDKDESPDYADAVVVAAKSGVKFLVERSCDDNAAKGRASRREREFEEDMRRAIRR